MDSLSYLKTKEVYTNKMLFLWSGLFYFKEKDVPLVKSGVFETDI